MGDPDETTKLRLMRVGWLDDDAAMRAELIEVLVEAHEDIGATCAVPLLRDDDRLSRRIYSALGLIRGAIGLLHKDETKSLASVKAMLEALPKSGG